MRTSDLDGKYRDRKDYLRPCGRLIHALDGVAIPLQVSGQAPHNVRGAESSGF
jgi:hypothetical protein